MKKIICLLLIAVLISGCTTKGNQQVEETPKEEITEPNEELIYSVVDGVRHYTVNDYVDVTISDKVPVEFQVVITHEENEDRATLYYVEEGCNVDDKSCSSLIRTFRMSPEFTDSSVENMETIGGLDECIEEMCVYAIMYQKPLEKTEAYQKFLDDNDAKAEDQKINLTYYFEFKK